MRLFTGLLCALAAPLLVAAESATTPKYGANAAAGHTFTHDGVELYYEIYGAGEPLLMIHGNGASIGSLAAQIAHFSERYRVIAMDSRDHGRSGDSAGKLTYETLTDDLAALLTHLRVDRVDVLGWSDGGIEALLLGIRHPDKVRKLVAMAPNLNPTDEALYPETNTFFAQLMASMPPEERATPAGQRAVKAMNMALTEPHIALDAIETIQAPTLIIVGDTDLVRTEHAVAIFEHLRNGALAVLPNSTHAIPFDDPAYFNATVERFLSTPFRKKDRLNDLMASLQKAMAESAP
ncbi:MAG TPA: alpha/beta hydrolase [Pseudomonadales bacterium]